VAGTELAGPGDAVTELAGPGDAVTELAGPGDAVTELAGPGDAVTELAGPGTPSTEVGAWAHTGIVAVPARTATIKLRNSIERRIGRRLINEDFAMFFLCLGNFFMNRFPCVSNAKSGADAALGYSC